MYPSVRGIFSSLTQSMEGVVPFMYLDVVGLVTTGTGNLIDSGSHVSAASHTKPTDSNTPTLPFDQNPAAQSALGLDWRKTGVHGGLSPANEGDPIASKDEIIAEWNNIKSHLDMSQGGGGTYQKVATLRLTNAGIQQLFDKALNGFEGTIKNNLPEWETWPADAQLATLLMAWAFGPGFTKSWPKWRAAALAKDFTTAAEEAKNKTLAAKRQNAIVTAFHNAADAIADHGDPSVVRYSALQHAANTAKAAVTDTVEQAQAGNQVIVDTASQLVEEEVGVAAKQAKEIGAKIATTSTTTKVVAGAAIAAASWALWKAFSGGSK